MDKELMIKLGMALHYSDVLRGHQVASFVEIGEPGREAYFKDAKALLEAAPGAGIEIRLAEVSL